jgi:hypothetical protein
LLQAQSSFHVIQQALHKSAIISAGLSTQLAHL